MHLPHKYARLIIFALLVVISISIFYFYSHKPPKEGMGPQMTDSTPKIAVVTAVIGGYDDLKEQSNVKHREKADWFYFTDNRNIKSKHWNVVYVNPAEIVEINREVGASNSVNYLPKTEGKTRNMMIAKYFKAQTHRIGELRDYDYFIWVDGSIQLNDHFIDNMLHLLLTQQNTLVHFKHSVRSNIQTEVDASYESYPEKYKSQDLNKQYRDYVAAGFPDDLGLFEMTIFARQNSQKNNDLFDTWWRENVEKSFQDQISYPYCLWKHQIRPDYVIPLNVFDNTEFSKSADNIKKHAW